MTRSSLNRSYEFLWKEYFRDPSLWLDLRKSKLDPSFPDFEHKITKESLWVDGWYNPCWVHEELNRRRGPPQAAKEASHIEDNQESNAFVALLRACARNKDLYLGIKAHDDISAKGLVKQCSDALVTMYAKCGQLAKAKELLDLYKSRDVFSWTALISGYAQKGQGHDAINCFDSMEKEGLSPDAVTYACILKACGSIRAADKGEEIHDQIMKQGYLEDNLVLGTALVDMYAKCGALAKAQGVLDDLHSRDVVCWNALIAGYAQHNQGEQALKCFERMECDCIPPNASTFVGVLKACGSVGAVAKGEEVHDEVVRQGLLRNDNVLGTALVDMYVKFGALTRAQQVLEELPVREVGSWSALIAGYAQHNQGGRALHCFEQMQREGLSPNEVTFTCLLKACGSIGAIDKGEQIRDAIAKQGLLGKNILLSNALVDMYAKCGALTKSQQVLEELPFRDVVTWNSLMVGYAQQGHSQDALNCYDCMEHEGLSPNIVTFTCILKACGGIKSVDRGAQIHNEIARQGLLENNIVLGSALVDMYAKCGALEKAQGVLEELHTRDVVTWNALISGYVQRGHDEEALNIFERMQQEDVPPNAATYLCILESCGNVGAAGKGEHIHDEVSRRGLLRDDIAVGTAVVIMYAKCGVLDKAQKVLEELPVRDVVCWSALIEGYAEKGRGQDAFNCFKRMQGEGLIPDAGTFTSILKACGSIRAADKGEEIHDTVVRHGLLGSNVVLGHALVDMYAKCGALAKSQKVLEELPRRDVVTWNALITGYTRECQVEEALKCLERMQHEGLCPNAVTYICILESCGSVGALVLGEQMHGQIVRQGLLQNDLVLGTALVDMYAKCGDVEKAKEVLVELPSQDVVSWSALIGGYSQKGQAIKAIDCFQQMQGYGISPDKACLFSVLSACSHVGFVEDAQRYFDNISTTDGLKPDLEHYTCMVDLFGRTGFLDEAVAVIQRTLPSTDRAIWSALLGACHRWGEVKIGRWAFDHAVELDRNDAGAYVIMADIYSTVGLQEEADNVEALRRENKAWERPYMHVVDEND